MIKYLKTILLPYVAGFFAWLTVCVFMTNGFIYYSTTSSSNNDRPVVNMKVLKKYETVTGGKYSHTEFILVLEKPDKSVVDDTVSPSTFYQAEVGKTIPLYGHETKKVYYIKFFDVLCFLVSILFFIIVGLSWFCLILIISFFIVKTFQYIGIDLGAV